MKRVELLLKEPAYYAYIQRNNKEENSLRCFQHDLNHHIAVARIAYILVLEHNDLNYFVKESNLSGKLAGKEVIYAAGLMHDIGKWKEYQMGIDHAAYGARLARKMLNKAFFNPNEVDIICRAIYEHRNISKDMSFLGERIHRADNLSRVASNYEDREDVTGRDINEINIDSFEY